MLVEGTIETAVVKLKITCRHCQGTGWIFRSKHVNDPCWSCEGRRSEWIEIPLIDFLVEAGVVFKNGEPNLTQAFPETNW